ncbi:MAG: type II toxin-antitoxin system VapB family antitoxin [Acidimicrobiales bacterium]
MALNIKDPATERLAAEVAGLTGESKTRAVRVALEERKARLALRTPQTGRLERLRRLLEEELWPQVPPEARVPITKAERETILGYGPEGH